MKQPATKKTSVMRWMVTGAVFVVMPTSLFAQTLPESVKQLESAVKELKSVAGKPDQMADWDKALECYNHFNDTLQNLEAELIERNDSLTIISDRREYIYKQKLALEPDVARKAEVVLTRQYDATDVEKTRRELEPMKNDERIASIYNRLGQYEAMTDTLRKVLKKVNQEGEDNENRKTFQSDTSRKNYLDGFFGEIQRILPSELFNPHNYPYLYGVLNEALEAKMNDTSCDYVDIIDKLQNH